MAFLVERYLPPGAADGLPACVARVARLCADMSGSGPAGRAVPQFGLYLPTEGTCFCLFRANWSNAVREVNAEADFALDRITDAVLLFPSEFGVSGAADASDRSPSNVQSEKG
jgi:hypothetical protein